MPRMMLRSVFIVLIAVIIAKFVWLGVTVHEAGNVMGNAQVSVVMNDAKRIQQSLEVVSLKYNFEEKGEICQIKDYGVFKAKVEEIWDSYGGMPLDLPSGQNFYEFSYRGDKGSYHITLKAKDKKGTLVHGTLNELWYE